MNSWFEQKIKWIKERLEKKSPAEEPLLEASVQEAAVPAAEVQQEAAVPVAEVQQEAAVPAAEIQQEAAVSAAEVQQEVAVSSSELQPETLHASAEAQPEEITEPFQPEAEQAKPESEPAQPEAEQTQPESEPAQPEAEQTQPGSEPAQPKAEQTQPETMQAGPEAEQTKLETARAHDRKKLNRLCTAGAAVCVAVLALVLWGTAGGQSVSGDATTEPPTEMETETEAVEVLRMAVVSAGYMPLLELDDFDPETDLVHISYETMKESLSGWICEFGRINIREEASFESKVVDYVVYGDQLSVYEQEGDFTRIKYISPMTGEQTVGYCYTAYISDTEPQGAQVYLNVPLYKQADYRWGAKLIGGYETLASAGCTTTCIAMVESYVNGRTIYPDAMVDQLPYTYDGLLTFPGRYTKYYGRDYLQVVVQKLHQGIPCLISGYTATGRTHWVVIVGYNGDGETFAPENFLINDPGANRSTLTDFFRDYPLVEKIVYYAR